jgi:hypothetical protein
MKQQFGLIQRPWGVYYLKNKVTGEQTSLKTRDKHEAERLLQAHNESESQPHFNLALARVYINGADPKLISRTWQEVMQHIVEKKTDETRRRWEVAIKDKNFDYIRNLPVAETRPEHFDRALDDGKVSTNVYLRRIHNHALGMEWLLKSVIPRLQWPRPIFGEKRAITSAEHAAIVARELNPERRDCLREVPQPPVPLIRLHPVLSIHRQPPIPVGRVVIREQAAAQRRLLQHVADHDPAAEQLGLEHPAVTLVHLAADDVIRRVPGRTAGEPSRPTRSLGRPHRTLGGLGAERPRTTSAAAAASTAMAACDFHASCVTRTHQYRFATLRSALLWGGAFHANGVLMKWVLLGPGGPMVERSEL